ncbi:MAG: serine hydrolase domain-containing protein [Mycobacterium sp.]
MRIVVAVALLLSSCAVPTTGTRSPVAQLAEPLRTSLQSTLDANRAKLGYPGAIVGVWTPEGEWFGITGTSGPDSQRPPRRDDHTRIGSLTKTFTVMAVLRLADQQRLALGDPIEKYVPGMPNGTTATLRDLARMTSGIANYSATRTFFERWSPDPAGAVFTPEDLIGFAKPEPPLFPAGSRMDYSNTNTALLGMVIEKVTGTPVAEVFEKELFEPLGMSGTSFPGPSPDLPAPHLDGITLQPDGPGGPVRNATDWNPSWTFTAGGMISTLDDMRVWTEALGTGGGLISEEMQREREASATSTVPPNTPELAYGLGFFTDRGWWGHNGALPGYTSYAAHHPARKTSVVVFVNSDIGTPDQPTPPADLLAYDLIGTLTG